MESFFSMIEWVPVLLSTFLAFMLGWLWYSPMMFYEKWRSGKGGELVQYPMWMPMAAQLGATLLLAIIVNFATVDGDVGHAVMVALTVGGFIKANGLYAGKTKYAISVEVIYIFAMVAIMVATNMLI